MCRTLLAVAAALAVVVSTSWAQEKAKPDPAPDVPVADVAAQPAVTAESESKVYFLNHIPASDAVKAVAQMLVRRGVVQPVPVSIANGLVVTAKPEAHAEIKQVLEALDQPPAKVAIEVDIAQVTWSDTGKSVDGAPVGNRAGVQLDLTKQGPELVARLKELEKQGHLEMLNKITLSALNNQQARLQVGDHRQMGRPSPSRSGFPGSTVVSAQTTGTMLALTPRVGHDGTITLQAQLEKSFVDSGLEEAAAAAGGQSSGVVTATLQTTVTLEHGETAVLGGYSASAKPGQSQLVVLVTARVAGREEQASK